ncbi:MAG: hypothetical protein ACI88A_004491 [Paraglaciecola sp.]|jgi:hypothetical protein
MHVKSFCIMFPVLDEKISGALLVAYRLAGVVLQGGINLKLIDYKQGLLYKLLVSDGVDFDFLNLDDYGWDSRVQSSDVVFGFNNDIYSYSLYFKNNPFVYFYDVYPPFWSRFLRPKGFELFGVESFVCNIAEKGFFSNALSVMECRSSGNISKRFPFLSNRITPLIPVSVNWAENTYVYRGLKEIKITYIGRSECWKITPLAKLMADCLLLNGIFKIFFNIVVSDVSVCKKILEDFGLDLNYFNIDFIENISPSELVKVIVDNTDIGFAMGTSALELSSHGVPTILADFSKNKFPDDYKYKWLYQADAYTLGLDLDDPENQERLREGIVAKQIIEDFLKKNKEISNKCHSYVVKNHLLQENYKYLRDLALKSSFKVKDLKSFHTTFFSRFQVFRKLVYGKRKYER